MRTASRMGVLALAGVAVTAAGAAALPSASLAADPPELIRSNSSPVITCVPAPAGTVRARVRLAMTVVNYDGWKDWADHMEMKVRLESTEPGLNIHSNWKGWKTPYLIQNRRHRYVITVPSDNKSGAASWRVHIKLIWHRPFPTKNITKNLYKPFDSSCADTGGGISLPPAQALPAAGGG